MKNIQRLMNILLLTSASACLAVDGSDEGIDELELRAADDWNEGGSDCDCPDCIQQDSCWALADSSIRVSIGADHIEDINDAGGAELRAHVENDQYVSFVLRVVDDPPRIRWSIPLKTGLFELSGGAGVMDIESMSDSEVEAIELSLSAPRELVLVVRGVPDYVVPRRSWLTFGTGFVDAE